MPDFSLFNHFIQMRLNEQECVVGERCILVPYRECHVQKYHDWMQNGELLEATSSERLTLAEEFEMRRSWQTDPDKLTFIILDVETYDKAQNEVEAMAGDINGFVIESDYEENRNRQKQITKCLELSVMIAEKAFRHRGLATEAVALMILYANAKLSMRNFVAKIDAANQASMLLFEKLHFHRLKFDETFQCFTMRFDFANCFQRLTEKFSLKVEPYVNE